MTSFLDAGWTQVAGLATADEFIQTGPAGSAFVFSGHVLHSCTRNKANKNGRLFSSNGARGA